MIVGIFVKQGQTTEFAPVKIFCDELDKFGIECVFSDNLSSADLLVIFGGDGTFLTAKNIAVKYGLPMVGINTGNVGFLSAFESDDVKSAAKCIYEGSLIFSERSLIEVECKGEKFLALNDAVIERDKTSVGNSVMAKLKLEIDGSHIFDLNSDGIIVSSPTGSTAYSLSAGGVVLSPDIKAFIATPICSHSLNSLPIVFSDDKEVKVSVLNNSCNSLLCCDGRAVKTLSEGDEVFIKKSESFLSIAESHSDFFTKLKEKLGK